MKHYTIILGLSLLGLAITVACGSRHKSGPNQEPNASKKLLTFDKSDAANPTASPNINVSNNSRGSESSTENPAQLRQPQDLAADSFSNPKLKPIIKQGTSTIIMRGESILAEAHPTASFASMQFVGYQLLGNEQYLLVFDLQYSGLMTQKMYWLKLLVTLNGNGETSEYVWGRDTGMIPPGEVSNALRNIVKTAFHKDES